MSKPQHTLLAVLSHPLRVKILEVVNERLMSPSEFVDRGLIPEELFSNPEQALSLASYHFRQLEKAGLIKVVETLPKRGAVEHVYGGLVLLLKNGTPLTLEQQQLSTVALLGLVARANSAIQSAKNDSRGDPLLDWTVATLDERGWEDVKRVLTEAYQEIREIKSAAENRLRSSKNTPISAVVGVLGFECDPLEIPDLSVASSSG